MMIIFDWEQTVIDVARTWPREGTTWSFFKFWTDYHQSFWLFLILVIVLGLRMGWNKLVIPSVLAFCAFGISDLVSRRLIKAFIMRPRPNFISMECVHSYCWGFVSSHATNITAAAVILCLYDRRNIIWTMPVTLLVCFSRIYLIDHYPLDVIGGMAMGSIVGISLWWLYQKIPQQSRLGESIQRMQQ